MGVKKLQASSVLDTDGVDDLMEAEYFGKVQTKRGDFQANVRATGTDAKGKSIGNVKIAGTLGSGDPDDPIVWEAPGKVGKIRSGDTVGFELVTLGNASISSFRTGRAVGVTINTNGTLGTVKAGEWHNGIIDALAVKSIKIASDMTDSRITLTQGVTNGTNLKSLKVGGVMDNVMIESRGHLGKIQAAAMRATLIDADIDAGASIAAVKVKEAFINSTIRAWQVGKASLGTVDTDNDGESLGVVTHSIISLAAKDLAGHNLTSRGTSLRRGDFRLRLVD